jgi:large subunit ribosomal protein L30
MHLINSNHPSKSLLNAVFRLKKLHPIGSEGRNMAKKKKEKVLRITLVKSPIGYAQRQKDTVRALGLRKMNQTVEHKDSPVVRGMVTRVSHLVQVEE